MKGRMGQVKSKVVAAIDFGTTYTGFAYAFSGNTASIVTAKHGTILKEDRVPTVVLLNPDGTFNSFGIDAEDEYVRLALENKHGSYRLFERFKMLLYMESDKLNRYQTMYDTEGRPMKALDLFSVVIKHLKELVIKSMIEGKAGETNTIEDRVIWMLSIPAIWSDSARQFMRLAAINAGIKEKRLRLVLEPEAAALYCKEQLLQITHATDVAKLPAGTKYILADLGGGTADICVHKILTNGRIEELYRATGGAFGGTKVNEEFVEFLTTIINKETWENFKYIQKYDYLRVMRDFEEEKTKFDLKNSVNFVINLPQSLINMLENGDIKSIVEKLNKSHMFRPVSVKDNKLICSKDLMAGFFKSSLIDGILPKLHDINMHCAKDNINIVLVVGGYAESQYVRDKIKEEMSKLKVVLVEHPRLAVLKGAVMMGFEPENTISRRSRYTYGFAIAVPFVEGHHPPHLKFKREGEILCNNIFSKLFGKNSILRYGRRFQITTSDTLEMPESKRTKVLVSLYRSSSNDPKYITDEGCLKAGEIIINPPYNGWPDQVDIDHVLIVGETEFTVRAVDRSSGREYDTYVDFL